MNVRVSVLAIISVSALCWIVPHHYALPPGPNLLHKMGWKSIVVGHRGARFVPGIPENTLSAFKYAQAHGADAVELDLRLSADGHLVVFHDPILELSKNVRSLPPSGETNVEKLTLEELEEVEVLCNDGEQQNSSEKTADSSVRAEEDRCIPPFERVLEWGRRTNTRLVLEIKYLSNKEARERQISLLADLFKHDSYLRERAFVISFNPLVLYRLRQIHPDIPMALLLLERASNSEQLSRWMKRVLERPVVWTLFNDVFCKRFLSWFLGVSIIGMDKHRESPEEVDYLMRRGILFYSWSWEHPEEVTEITASSMIVVSNDYQAFTDALAQYRHPRQ